MSEHGWQRFAEHCVESEIEADACRAYWKKFHDEHVREIVTPFGTLSIWKESHLNDASILVLDEEVKHLTKEQWDLLMKKVRDE